MIIKWGLVALVFLLSGPEVLGTNSDSNLNLDGIEICIIYERQMTCLPASKIWSIFKTIGDIIPGLEEAGIFVISIFALLKIGGPKRYSENQSSQ